MTRTDSPDNDSAFSDNVSMLSSESSASSGASGSGGVSSKEGPGKQHAIVSLLFYREILGGEREEPDSPTWY